MFSSSLGIREVLNLDIQYLLYYLDKRLNAYYLAKLYYLKITKVFNKQVASLHFNIKP